MAPSRSNDEGLLGLIELAYTASEDPRQWESFLSTLIEWLPGKSAHLLHHDLASTGSVISSVHLDPEAMRLYNEHFHHVDPFALNPVARAAVPGICATDEMFVASADLIRTEYFNDFAVKFDNTKVMSTLLHKNSGAASALTIVRGRRNPSFGTGELRFLRELSPHIRRALQIHQRIHRVVREHDVAVNTLDVLSCAVFLVDRESKIVLANRKGRALLETRDGLSTDGGRLCALSPAGTRTLRYHCAAVAATRTTVPRSSGGAFIIGGRPSGRPPLQVLVAPAASRAPLGLTNPRVAALVFVSDPSEERSPSEGLLQQAYGLTPAESHVAARIAVGRTLAEIAAERRSALETVRRQTKQILAKTGARHRSELVRMLSAMPPAAPEYR